MDRQRAAYLLQAHSSHLERPINNKPNCSPCVSNCKPRCGFVSKTACKRGRGGWGDGNYLKIPWWIPTPHLAVLLLHLQRQGREPMPSTLYTAAGWSIASPSIWGNSFCETGGFFFVRQHSIEVGQHGFEIEMHAWAKNVNKGTEDRMYSFGNVFCCCVLTFF